MTTDAAEARRLAKRCALGLGKIKGTRMQRDGLTERAIADRLHSLMLAKLAERRGRGHWAEYSTADLLDLLNDEVYELDCALNALRQQRNAETVSAALRECADVANYCAMIMDNIERRGS